jgi:putative oxidoreductase
MKLGILSSFWKRESRYRTKSGSTSRPKLAIALILSLYSRLAALLSLPILIGATWAHIGNGWMFSNAGGGWEFPALLVVLAVTVAMQGNGAFAIRRLPIIDRFIPEALEA